MEYRHFPGTDINASVLGFGTMRLPCIEKEIDKPNAIKMLHEAIDSGINYFDTAYPYHGGHSEEVVGEALEGGWRNKITLTTKLPMWKIEKAEDMEATLDEQLKKLKTDHVDFYLLHALDNERFEQAVRLDAFGFLDKMVQKGKIRYPGFSFHDNADVFKKIATAYDWKLIQVQMNLLDEFNQATLAGVHEYAENRGIGVVVMEPLRGGLLAKQPPEEIQALYDAAPVKRSHIDWAFRWLYNQSAFKTILSGMSSFEQLRDNIRIFADTKANCMTDEEIELITNVRKAYEARIKVGCTGCEYCQPCPCGVNIPGIFRGYNAAYTFGKASDFAPEYKRRFIEKETDASKCAECGACETKCPQHLSIRELLKQIDSECRN